MTFYQNLPIITAYAFGAGITLFGAYFLFKKTFQRKKFKVVFVLGIEIIFPNHKSLIHIYTYTLRWSRCRKRNSKYFDLSEIWVFTPKCRRSTTGGEKYRIFTSRYDKYIYQRG
jgi:hypothetical protein